MTNRDKLNQMSNKELSRFLGIYNGCKFCIVKKSNMCYATKSCRECWEIWLESEAEE